MKYAEIKEVVESLQTILEVLAPGGEVSNNSALAAAEQTDNEVILSVVANSLTVAHSMIEDAIDSIVESIGDFEEPNEESAEEFVENIAAIASVYDASDDEKLRKMASAFDQILLTVGVNPALIRSVKAAEDKEIDKLRAKYREEASDSVYKGPKERHDKQINADESIKAIENSVKQYRILEAPLNTRTCPDHPGAQVMRLGDNIVQCDLDKKIYNYEAGFTTMSGNKVPGSTILNQTQGVENRELAETSFETRETKLNNS